MAGCPDRALDTHIYQAWNIPASRATFYNDACQQKSRIAAMEREFGPVIVGEWSLATDNCAMWLNGFNDNLSGYPMLPCKYVRCPDPYMGFEQPGTPVDPGELVTVQLSIVRLVGTFVLFLLIQTLNLLHFHRQANPGSLWNWFEWTYLGNVPSR